MDSGLVAITANILEDFSDIKAKHKLSEPEFGKALEFCLLVSQGRSRSDAYRQAVDYDCTAKDASTYAYRFMVRKYVSEILDRIVTGNHILMCDKHIGALTELYEIGMDGEISPKVRVEALSKFVDMTKRPDKAKDVTVNINLGRDMLEKLEEKLKLMGSSALLVQKDGSIVDAEVIKNG